MVILHTGNKAVAGWGASVLLYRTVLMFTVTAQRWLGS